MLRAVHSLKRACKMGFFIPIFKMENLSPVEVKEST